MRQRRDFQKGSGGIANVRKGIQMIPQNLLDPTKQPLDKSQREDHTGTHIGRSPI